MEEIFVVNRLKIVLIGDYPPGTREFLELSHDQYERARPFVEQHRALIQQDSLLAREWGWKLYYRLKQHVEKVRARRHVQDRLPGHLAREIAKLLDEYEALRLLHQADLLQSLMLLQVCRLPVPWARALVFCYRVRAFDTLRPEDRRPYVRDGRSFPSLEQWLVQFVAKALAKLPPHALAPRVFRWALAQVEAALPRLPEDALWVRYHLACVFLRQRRAAEARPLLRPVLVQHQKKSWIWKKVAQAHLPDCPSHALTAWVQALRCARNEHPAVRFRIHVALANLLAQQQRYDEAAAQLQAAQKLAPEVSRPGNLYHRLCQQSWFRERAHRTDLPTEPALQIGWDYFLPTQEKMGVIVSHQPEKARTVIRLSPTRVCSARHQDLPEVASLAPGTVVRLRVAGNEVLALEPRPEATLPELVRPFQGHYQPVREKPFAFVRTDTGDRIFVPPGVASQLKLPRNARVQGLAERTLDLKKNRPGWSALTIAPLS
ncbi:MAG: hypothetical protein Q9M35_07565 [Rhodothermus sp.]|nr:hypothetical protein [Rhodothermus sp.]